MCKSCNYTALTGEVRLNYTPVGQAESMRRQVELHACLCNRGECEEWQRPETGADAQQLSQSFTGTREESPPSFTLFSSRLQEQIVWSDTEDKWGDVSQTLKHSCGAVCTCHPATNQAAWILLQLHSSAFPSRVCQHFCHQRWRRFTLQQVCMILYWLKQVFIHAWLSLRPRSGYICCVNLIWFTQQITCFFTSLKSWPLIFTN